MSTIPPINRIHNDAHRDDRFESMNPLERVLGMLVLLILLLLAILLRSM